MFETANTKEIEHMYSQNQRRESRFAIIDRVEDTQQLAVKKTAQIHSWVYMGAATISVSVLFFLLQSHGRNMASSIQTPQNILGIQDSTVSRGVPVRLTIPAINVNANIQSVGVTQSGDMEVPDNAIDVGWFKVGPHPGEKGSGVIAGHVDGENGEAGVFANLNMIKKGEKVYVKNDKGMTITFTVRESRVYDPGYAEDVFSSNDGAHLNLITCDGIWDGEKKSFSKRLVVFTDITRDK